MALPVVAAIASYAGGKIKEAAALATIVVILSWIMDWLGILPDWIWSLVKTALDALWLLLKDFFLWIFDSVLGLLVSILDSLEFDMSAFNPANYIGGASADTINMLSLVRVPEAIAIILSAIVIRLLLQLIPFTRLGS